MKKLYGGIDLHGHNSVVVVLDEADQVLYRNDCRMSWRRFFRNSPPFGRNSRGWL